MTLPETRQLGIEVERRLQTILPTLKLENKIDTEDIYSFLNLCQTQLVDAIYRQDDQVESGTRNAAIIEDIIRTLTAHQTLNKNASDGTLDVSNTTFNLPNDYYQYIRSTSSVNGTYKGNVSGTVSNKLIKESDATKVINQYYDKNRILRNPVVVLEKNLLKVIHDNYTTINNVDLTYIKMPNRFSVLTDTPCELPYECFDQLVAGTVELYINHLTATQPKTNQKREVNNDTDRNNS